MTTKHDLEHRPERPVLGLVNWQRIPEVMKPFDQWTYWHYEWRVDRDKGTGKWIKRPKFYDPDAPPGCRFQKAAVNDPDTFMSYDLAKRVVDFGEAHGKQVGLMFMLTAEDPLVVLDFDDCRNPKTGQIAPDVAEILHNLDTYTEISPSQTGVKTYLLGKKPGDRCSRSGSPIQVEIYEKGRPLAVTGDTLQWLPQVLMPRQEQLNDLYNYIFPPPPPRPPVPDMGYVPRSCPELPDDEMLQAARMARNGDRFEALWAGDSSGYRSRSEGDFALAFRLAFWVGPDQARIENLMWQSGRVRDKWHKRPHYVRDTVAKAIAQQTHHYGDARPDPIAAELAGIDWSQVEEVCSAPPAPPPPAPPTRPPIPPLTAPCDTDADLARLINRSYYDHERYFCPNVQRHMLEDRRTGNPIEILKRCGKCPTCIRRRIDAILARVRHQLADLDRQGIPYYECVSPRACWDALRKRMQRAAGDSLRYHRMASPDENYVVNTAGEGIQTTAEHVLCELEARLHEHFHGPRVFYSSQAWEEVNLAEHEKHCDYRFPVDEISDTLACEIAAEVQAHVENTAPREPNLTQTQGVRVVVRGDGWDADSLAHYYAMRRACEILPRTCILDYDPDDHGRVHNGGRVHGPGAASVFSQDNSG